MEENRQTKNKVILRGILKEKKIEFKNSKSGKLMGIGKLVVIIDDAMGRSEVEVKVMQMANKANGESNSLFKALQTIENTYKTEEEHGEGNGEYIKVEGSIEDGTYYSVNKEDFVEKLEIRGVFINRDDRNVNPPCCKVAFENYLSKITPRDQGELEVELIGIGYNGVAMPITAIVPAELTAAFQSRYMVGCTSTLNFSILNQVITEQIQEQVGFGVGMGEAITKTIIKRVIFGGSPVEYTNTISEETVRQGLAIRAAKLEEKKENAKNSSSTNMNVGFGDLSSTGVINTTIPTGQAIFGERSTSQVNYASFPIANFK